MKDKALITTIQRYSLHDGPGIRTVVFFKGCPLQCKWCCNPETQSPAPELSFIRSKCIGLYQCKLCFNVCPSGAIDFSEQGFSVTDRAKCTSCMQCAAVCPSKARKAEGIERTASEILDEVEKDAVFYNYGDGGITISGGEPLMKGDFLIRLLAEARKRHIHIAMETCGYGEYEVLKSAAAYLDMILYDIKTLDNEKHIKFTGKPNDLILENFERLCAEFPQLKKTVRTPLIPDFNSKQQEIDQIRLYLHNKENVCFETLDYHRLGLYKYEMLGRRYEMLN